jgi:hypothetical protein
MITLSALIVAIMPGRIYLLNSRKAFIVRLVQLKKKKMAREHIYKGKT